jgi:hypothetical protein
VRVWDLKPGVRVLFVQPFKDFDGQLVPVGARTVLSHDVFPYDDGHTLRFDDGLVVRLSSLDEGNEAVMRDDAGAWWVPA